MVDYSLEGAINWKVLGKKS